ncbi:MAG: DMT family transporter [Burkholderiaceae bacterium]
MRTRDLFDLLLLSVLWGAAYLFTRAAAPAFGPVPLVALRLGMAALLLAPLLAWRGHFAALAAHPWPLLMLGLPLTAVPFVLITFASLHLTAGMVAMLNATAPLFAALLGHFVLHERLGAWRTAGLMVGFAGVAALVWGNASFKTTHGAAAVAAVLAASAIWGASAHFARRRLAGVDSMAITVGSLASAGLALAPAAAWAWPAHGPSLRAWSEVCFLGIASSGLGFLLYFRLLRRIGPVRAMSVTFLNPVVALISAAAYLGEAITWPMAAAGAVVLIGTAMTLGLIGRRPPGAPA